MQVEDDEPITGEHEIETLNLLRSSGNYEVAIGLEKRTQATVGALVTTLPVSIEATREITRILNNRKFHLRESIIYEQES